MFLHYREIQNRSHNTQSRAQADLFTVKRFPTLHPVSSRRRFIRQHVRVSCGCSRRPARRAPQLAVRTIMDHWLGLGVSGFRVDMAASLVKDDPGGAETARSGGNSRTGSTGRTRTRPCCPNGATPPSAVPAGFHADFSSSSAAPPNGRPLRSLWSTGTATTRPVGRRPLLLRRRRRGSPSTFLAAYRDALAAIGEPGHIALPTANHDFARLLRRAAHPRAAAAAFAFQLTFPTLPAIYYGDEIGMRYLPGLPDTEGSVMRSGYNRAGSRTPMQWDACPNAGFSAAPAAPPLPAGRPGPRRPTVAGSAATVARCCTPSGS